MKDLKGLWQMGCNWFLVGEAYHNSLGKHEETGQNWCQSVEPNLYLFFGLRVGPRDDSVCVVSVQKVADDDGSDEGDGSSNLRTVLY